MKNGSFQEIMVKNETPEMFPATYGIYDRAERKIGVLRWYSIAEQYSFFPLGGTALSWITMFEIMYFTNKAMDEYARYLMRRKRESGGVVEWQSI